MLAQALLKNYFFNQKIKVIGLQVVITEINKTETCK